MEKCCIKGCDSHKYIGEKDIGYFPFPVHDEILLKKWLTQINLPNWKPGAYHYICSMHFRSEDIDSHPNRKQPFLNPTSIPTIFLGKPAKTASADQKGSSMILTKTPISLPLQADNVNDNGKCNTSVLQSMPVFLTPTRIAVQNAMQISAQYSEQISKLNWSGAHNSMAIIVQNSNVPSAESPNPTHAQMQESSKDLAQRLPIVQPRLRTILPKPDFFYISRLGGLPIDQNILQPLSLPKSDISGVPKIVNSRYPDNKRPVLRISVNKHCKSHTPDESPCPSNKKAIDSSSNEMEKNKSADRANSLGKEITIENSATNRTVTFRLDPKSGEIVVTTQPIEDSSRDEEHEETMRTERKVDDTCNQPSAAKLRQLYTKGQRECNALRKRLRRLRQRHREEQEEIEKLQEHLTQIGDRVKKTCCEDTSESRGTKRKEAETSVQSSNDEDYENLIREAKSTKADIRRTRRGLSTITNGQLKTEGSVSRLTSNNEDSELLEDKNYASQILQSSDETIGEINHKCKTVLRTMDEHSIDLNPDSGSDDTICREEFLDAEFLLE